MTKQRHSRYTMKCLRHGRTHARSLASRQHHSCKCVHLLMSMQAFLFSLNQKEAVEVLLPIEYTKNRLGCLDSNQGSQIQSLLPYRLATPDYHWPAEPQTRRDYNMLQKY